MPKSNPQFTYKHLIEKLENKTIHAIELPSNEMVKFIKYIAKIKYKPKLYFTVSNGKVIVTKKQQAVQKSKPQLV